MRTVDLLNIAKETSHALHNLYSLECWGGATFDVAMRFLYEDPWDRLRKMRKLIPNIPFQMLLRGANGVAYASLPDNAIDHFVDQARRTAVDIFRVFDASTTSTSSRSASSAVHKAGGVAEGTVCYSGDMLNPAKKYNLPYYLDLVDKLVALKIHVLGIKDMAGVLKPHAAKLLVGAIRAKYPDLPIHVHTHDSAGTGVASMVACAQAGADAVDAATDSLSGMTSQPSINAILASLEGSDLDPGLDVHHVRALDSYWAQLRLVYSPFEAHLTGPDPEVYEHEIPGGQLTNMMFPGLPARPRLAVGRDQEGLRARQRPARRRGQGHAHVQGGGRPGPVHGVQQVDADDVRARAAELDFPGSVLEFFEGMMGQPYGGFPRAAAHPRPARPPPLRQAARPLPRLRRLRQGAPRPGQEAGRARVRVRRGLVRHVPQGLRGLPQLRQPLRRPVGAAHQVLSLAPRDRRGVPRRAGEGQGADPQAARRRAHVGEHGASARFSTR